MSVSTMADLDDMKATQDDSLEEGTTVENHLVVSGLNRKASSQQISESDAPVQYTVYRRRWLGLAALCALNISAGMNWLWFAAISVSAAEQFNTTTSRINWLSNSVCLIYIPVSLAVPAIVSRFGLRNPCITASIIACVGAWIRYAGTSHSLSPDSAYALLMIGQIVTGLAQPFFQVVGPRYSELWFDLKGRTTATAIIAIANPFGCALGELFSPLYDNVRHSLLTLAIITTVLSLTCVFITKAPPTPPTFAGSHEKSASLVEVLEATAGVSLTKGERSKSFRMTPRQRLDFVVVTILFSVFVGAADAFFILVDQIFNPYGYSNDAAGNMGGALIIAGLIAAIVSAPLFDRVFTYHLGLVAKCVVPVLGLAWLVLIWDVRRNNYAGLYPVFVLIGVGSFVLLPIALEIGVEVTSSAESSSAVFWGGANALTVVFVVIMDALRASESASPPQNMDKSIIFLGVIVMVSAASVFLLEAKQVRRETDTHRANLSAAKFDAARTRAESSAGILGDAGPMEGGASRPGTGVSKRDPEEPIQMQSLPVR